MKTIRILWEAAVKGTVRAENGTVPEACRTVSGCEAVVSLTDTVTAAGPYATLVHVESDLPFSFFLRDVTRENPLYLPRQGAVVTTGDDGRSYKQIVAGILAQNRLSKRRRQAEEPEYSFDRAARETLDLKGPVWLGISRDMRLFQVALHGRASGSNDRVYDEIWPHFASVGHRGEDLPELETPAFSFRMLPGRGIGCRNRVKKQLAEGCLPILEATDRDDSMIYRTTMFTTLEKSPLTAEHLRGTDMYVADACCIGYNQTPEQAAVTRARLDGEFSREEETVLFVRVTAENSGKAPAYAYLLAPTPQIPEDKRTFSPETGMTALTASGRICVTAALNRAPLFSPEAVLLLQPGETAVFDFRIPHTPVSPERAAALAAQSFEDRLAEAESFWKAKLAGSAEIRLPEKRIEAMIRAGLLHLEIGYYGREPEGAVVPSNGNYAAIGSESSPGIQFLDSMGQHGLAARALRYFAEKQRENGFMQNLDGYMLETGSVLWTMGEHWRLTHDTAWAEQMQTCIVKAADYLIRWRGENLDEALKGGKGYGMIKGKVADPEDHFHSFMLNAGACAGLRAAGEVLADICPEKAAGYRAVAAEMRENIRESLARSLALSPAIPVSDGTWIRPIAPWPEYIGPVSLYAQGGFWHSHGSFLARDMLGAAYLILQGVVTPQEPMGREILDFYTEYLTVNNTAFSQPYYSPHPYGQLLLGDTELFLQEFYSGCSSLSDREIYSFWEHFFCGSPHKLHEEAWFLMRCRWMLALECPDTRQLNLLWGIPRTWLSDGESLVIKGLYTYYGRMDLTVHSELSAGKISVTLSLTDGAAPLPDAVCLRLPHPDGKKAVHASTGRYDPDRETVTWQPAAGETHIDLFF